MLLSAAPELGSIIRLGWLRLAVEEMQCMFTLGMCESGLKLAKPDRRGRCMMVMLTMLCVLWVDRCGVSELLLLRLSARHGMIFMMGILYTPLSGVKFGCRTLILLWNPPIISFCKSV